MADIAVVPSLPAPYWQEQFGMVLAEAMSSGVPVIATRSGSIPEVVGDAALLVTPYDVEELATALRDLAADLARRADLAARGRGRAEDIYAVDVVAAQLAAAYRRVLAS
jgi:glycosyltransferase involved in cell wall biosynthesis